jgi:hypothetical protein
MRFMKKQRIKLKIENRPPDVIFSEGLNSL